MDIESFLMGSISGTAQMIVGHPLDTIKVWKQNKIPITELSTEYIKNIIILSSLSRFNESTEYAEKVVNPPQKPIIRK